MMRHVSHPAATKRFRKMKWAALGLLLGMAAASAGAVEATTSIRLNTIGYLPDAEKKAVVAGACTNFSVINAEGSQTEVEGKVTGPVTSQDTSEALYIADFSSLATEGEYQLEIPGIGRSAAFRVGKDVYREAFYTVERSMYLWRC